MRTWFFTEDAYPYLPDADSYESIRVNLPNKNFDPKKGKKRSLLIGCNYGYTPRAELKASHDDVRSMKVSHTIEHPIQQLVRIFPILTYMLPPSCHRTILSMCMAF